MHYCAECSAFLRVFRTAGDIISAIGGIHTINTVQDASAMEDTISTDAVQGDIFKKGSDDFYSCY